MIRDGPGRNTAARPRITARERSRHTDTQRRARSLSGSRPGRERRVARLAAAPTQIPASTTHGRGLDATAPAMDGRLMGQSPTLQW